MYNSADTCRTFVVLKPSSVTTCRRSFSVHLSLIQIIGKQTELVMCRVKVFTYFYDDALEIVDLLLLFTQRRSVAKNVECFQRNLFVCVGLWVCVFVCQHYNFRTSKHRMMKLGGRYIVQRSRPSSNLGVIASLRGAHPLKCGVRLRRWENQRRLSSIIIIIIISVLSQRIMMLVFLLLMLGLRLTAWEP